MKDVMKKIVEAVILLISFTVGGFIARFIGDIMRIFIGDTATGVIGGVLMFMCCLFIVSQKK